MQRKFELRNNWKFRVVDTESENSNIPSKIKKWIEAEIPGTVHTDLLHAGIIEDPFYADNEFKLKWIDEVDWVYKTEFDYQEIFDINKPVALVFEGLDTIAEIWLNGKMLGESKNMFLKYEFDITNELNKNGNELKIVFKSPVNFSKEEKLKYDKHQSAFTYERVFIRKAQYSFGWDWGPSFPTMGIWRSVYLVQRSEAYIKNVKFTTNKIYEDSASVSVHVYLQGNLKNNFVISIKLINNEQNYEKEIAVKNGNEYEIIFLIKEPKLWWPNGVREPNLYRLETELLEENKEVIDTIKKKVGIRTVSLKLEEKNKPTFKFIINNEEIFIKGVNWIPADSFLPRVKYDKYFTLLSLAKDANINMVRVWGGGIYEDDSFYEICDEQGILVWQDFMFACASYPEHEEFIENIKSEIRHNIERLRHHPSLAIWCGNNENEWGWFYEKKTSFKEMPGYNIYHKLIPDILNENDPARPYLPSTPFGDDDDPNSVQSGNTHEWDIWSSWIDYNEVVNDKSLFVTEFGFQAPANIDTLDAVIPSKYRNVQSSLFEYHNKQIEGTERLFRFLAGHLPVRTDWGVFIYLTQLNQGLALKTCIEHWRINSQRTNGTIIWQLNDCWPVTSWSIIDSNVTPKLSYYFVKNAYAPIITSIKKVDDTINVHVLNSTKNIFIGKLVLTICDTRDGFNITDKSTQVEIDSKRIHEYFQLSLLDLPINGRWILLASLYDKDNNPVHRNFFLEQKWKHIELPSAEIKIELESKANKSILCLSTNQPAFFVDLYHPDLIINDRGFTILPGERKKVLVKGNNLNERIISEIQIYSLNKYLQANS